MLKADNLKQKEEYHNILRNARMYSMYFCVHSWTVYIEVVERFMRKMWETLEVLKLRFS